MELSATEIAEAKATSENSGMGGAEALEEQPSGSSEEEEVETKPKVEDPKPKHKASEEDGAREEEEDKGKDDEEDKSSKSRTRTVPYELLKSERQKQATLKTQIAELQNAVAELRAGKKDTPKTEEMDEIEAEIAKIAKEDGMDIDTKGLAKILRRTVELAQKNDKKGELSDEIKEKLKLLDSIEAKQKETAEKDLYETQWNDVLPSLRKQYPNASDAMLAEAKRELDLISHTKEWHDKDLDYIVFKNSKKFETLLKVATKAKSGEAGKHIGEDTNFESGEDDETVVNIEDMTPAIMKAREARESSRRETAPKDYRIQKPIR